MSHLSNKISRNNMLSINLKQKEYYEEKFSAGNRGRLINRRANILTNIWTMMRRKMMALGHIAGVDDHIFSLHLDWMSDLRNARVLDFGCYDGNQLSLWMADNCMEYLGIDLSEQAVRTFNAKLRSKNLSNAKAISCDILQGTLPQDHFDLVYAHGVLHHFANIDVILRELSRVLKEGGTVITIDPMMTEPTNIIFRKFFGRYRSNKEWEWPFTRETFRTLKQYFEIENLQGHFGMVRIGFPFLMLPGLQNLGRVICRYGLKVDNQYGNKFGTVFYFCWKVTMKLRKQMDSGPPGNFQGSDSA